jgi:hypothetical protein
MKQGEMIDEAAAVGRTVQQIEAEAMRVVQAMRQAKARKKDIGRAFADELKDLEAKLNDLCGQREAVTRPKLPGIE